jgi:imidazoleglycerol phosphate synthase glutamine amidotransferase subunit HisH
MYVSIVDYGTGNLNSVSKALEVAATKLIKK